MQNSLRWVLPVRSVSRCRSARSVTHGRRVLALADGPLHLGEGDLELVERLVPALVDPRRLARRPDEAAGEDVGQRRVVLPVRDEAAEQVGAPQQRGVGGRGPAEGEVVATAGAGVGAVEVELLGRQARLPRVLVERLGQLDELGPGRGRLDVDLDDARVRRDRQGANAGVPGERVALEDHGVARLGRGLLDDAEELGAELDVLHGREEDEQVPVALLDDERVAGRVVDVPVGRRRDDVLPGGPGRQGRPLLEARTAR